MRIYITLFVAGIISFTSCKKSDNASSIPVIAYSGMAPNTVVNGSSKDTVSISFSIIDGDGDLGNNPNSGTHDIYLKDSRTAPNEEIPFYFPEIPIKVLTKGSIVKADCTIKVYAALFLLLRPDHPKGDTLTYDIYIKDKAGNKSNIIKTPPIYIRP